MSAALPISLTDAEPRSYWHSLHSAGATTEPLSADTSADLVVIGGGFTGLWTAVIAKRRDPSRDVVLLESHYVGFGATGRNGGFISDSLTHGWSHGLALWPESVEQLAALGRANLAALAAEVTEEGLDVDLRMCGKTLIAVTDHQASALPALAEVMDAHGEQVEVLDRAEVRADVNSPTYLGGLRIRSGGGTLDPLALAHGLRDWALRLGVRLHERTPVTSVEAGCVVTPLAQIRARQIALATNAYPAPVRRLRKYVVPVYDHVLVTEPLTGEQWARVGWPERQGLTDAGNQFHYYRPLADGRILWGGYDANYYFGSSVDPGLEQRAASFQMLASHFAVTFPQLEGVRFTHRWAGLIDTTSRFVPYVAADRNRRIGHAIGFTGLGVAFSRFAAGAMLDALDGQRAPAYLSQAPTPFPPEPLRYAGIQVTRAALAREDRSGRRGAWLRMLDSLGVGFNS